MSDVRFDRIDVRLDSMMEKLDKVNDGVSLLRINAAQQSIITEKKESNLEKHMIRSDQLEKIVDQNKQLLFNELKPIKRYMIIIEIILKALGAFTVLIPMTYYTLKIMGKI